MAVGFFINLNEQSSVWPPACKIVHIIDIDLIVLLFYTDNLCTQNKVEQTLCPGRLENLMKKNPDN